MTNTTPHQPPTVMIPADRVSWSPVAGLNWGRHLRFDMDPDEPDSIVDRLDQVVVMDDPRGDGRYIGVFGWQRFYVYSEVLGSDEVPAKVLTAANVEAVRESMIDEDSVHSDSCDKLRWSWLVVRWERMEEVRRFLLEAEAYREPVRVGRPSFNLEDFPDIREEMASISLTHRRVATKWIDNDVYRFLVKVPGPVRCSGPSAAEEVDGTCLG